MLIITFHGKQDQTFTKIYKFYNRITTRVLINNGRFRVLWCSQCNGCQKINVIKDVNVPLKLLLICRKIWQQEKLTFIRISYIIPFKTLKKF